MSDICIAVVEFVKTKSVVVKYIRLTLFRWHEIIKHNHLMVLFGFQLLHELNSSNDSVLGVELKVAYETMKLAIELGSNCFIFESDYSKVVDMLNDKLTNPREINNIALAIRGLIKPECLVTSRHIYRK